MRKLLNKLTCVALSLTCLMGCMATSAFAYSGGETGERVDMSLVMQAGSDGTCRLTRLWMKGPIVGIVLLGPFLFAVLAERQGKT